MFGLRRRIFLVEKLIHTLIVTRVFTTHLLSVHLFITVIAILLVAKYFKEGFTPTLLALAPILLLEIWGEINESLVAQYIGTVLGGLLHFIPLKLYWLPSELALVGMK